MCVYNKKMKTYIDTIISNIDVKDILKDYTVNQLRRLLKENNCKRYSKLNKRELYVYTIMLNASICIQKYYINKNAIYLNKIDPITLENIESYSKNIIFNRITKSNKSYYCSRYIINKYADYILISGDINDIFTKEPLTLKDLTRLDRELQNNNFHYPRLKLILQNKPTNSYEFLIGLERQLNDHVTSIRDFCIGELYIDIDGEVGEVNTATFRYIEMTYINDIKYIINKIREVDVEFARFVINDIIEYIKFDYVNINKIIVSKVLEKIYNI